MTHCQRVCLSSHLHTEILRPKFSKDWLQFREGNGDRELRLSESWEQLWEEVTSDRDFLFWDSLFRLVRLRSEYREPLVMGNGDCDGVKHFLTGLWLGDSLDSGAPDPAFLLSEDVPVCTRVTLWNGESREAGLLIGMNGDSTRSKKFSSQTEEFILGVFGFEFWDVVDSFFNNVRWSSNSVDWSCSKSLTE